MNNLTEQYEKETGQVALYRVYEIMNAGKRD